MIWRRSTRRSLSTRCSSRRRSRADSCHARHQDARRSDRQRIALAASTSGSRRDGLPALNGGSSAISVGQDSRVEERVLGKTERPVSVIGLGTWQLGADWGEVSDTDALAVLEAASEAGVTFFDTADVYGDGRSEQLIGRFLADHPDLTVTVATKMGRRVEQRPEHYTLTNFRAWTDRSRRNLGVDQLDLVQLHCPPASLYSSDEMYDALDTLVDDGVIANYGVSVETCDEALTAISRRGTATVQIILNAFRRKPLDYVLPAAHRAGVGIIARVPLASGLLSGRYTADTQFAENDHRNFNRHGESFDVGETFSGVDFETGVAAAKEFSRLVTEHLGDLITPAQAALAWVVQQPGVTTVIPGARSVEQAQANATAGELARLGEEFIAAVRDLYDERLRDAIHPRW
jgi:aryl-alcohol dehydrogenase-like predicted oxidoreductase